MTQILERASRGVLRIRVGDSLASGWLITQTLAVVPAQVVTGIGGEIVCEHSDNHAAPADVVFVPERPDDADVALLRLRVSLPGTDSLPLAQKMPPEGTLILVLHHPLGTPRQQVTFGRLTNVEPPLLQHSAPTGPGSSGGPVLTSAGAVLSMTTQRTLNRHRAGPTVAAMLETLRLTPMWQEIQLHHRLIDLPAMTRRIGGVARGFDRDLTFAAVRWTVNPVTLTPAELEQLAPLVADNTASAWTLRSAERERLINAAGSRQSLLAARGTDPITNSRQAVIDQILNGPPYDLDAVAEEALPYWLQAVRWFASVEPELPTPAEVNRQLERRRLRSRLTVVAGPGFRGRDEELSWLKSWYNRAEAGPMVVTGIGGIGKSALVARFAARLPEQTLLCWLDFDRADLAPDDADSVLSLLTDQMAVQIDGFVPPMDQPWPERARALGSILAARAAPLLVLDGFEVAQHVREHGEIWPLLEAVLEQAPSVRVVVSGRAGVPGLSLRGVEAEVLPLEGLARADSEAWLREHGVTEPGVLERVLDLAHGIPLALRLAVRYVDSGGTAADLPETLPKALVEGLLYTRILERVMDPALTSIAWDALVLRRLTVEILDGVLHDRLPEGLSAAEVFERLAYELALVTEHAEQLSVAVEGPPGELTLRPEVRVATLSLLELDDAGRVRAVDERAAAWYARQDLAVTANRAELVYHRLRLDDRAGAAAAWNDDVAPLLRHAEEEIPASAGTWLVNRVVLPESLASWEARAVDRIIAALSRGLVDVVPEILRDRAERTRDSALIFYDAWMMAEHGQVTAAWDLLDNARADDVYVARDRAVLQAWLAAMWGLRADADRLLAGLETAELWGELPDETALPLLVWAARMRLTVDLRTESQLLSELDSQQKREFGEATRDYLLPQHAVLRELSELIGPTSLVVEFPLRIWSFTARQRDLEAGQAAVWRAQRWSDPSGPWSASDLGGLPKLRPRTPISPRIAAKGLDLAVLGSRRWALATRDESASGAMREAVRQNHEFDALSASIGATVAALRSQPLVFHHGSHTYEGVDEILDSLLSRIGPTLRAREAGRAELARGLLFRSRHANVYDPQTGVFRVGDVDRPNLRSVLLYILGPDPLTMLFRLTAGLPLNDQL
ncbi:S1 family peptidase [Paractinoplanes lichenicola]|uniref:Serine protease n=1 Tax=Paractinoplanes lichenicola TaxID=2802976 RepID=A0ABS1VXM1_9ACTN|nr:serine protease [Actinoplanes lichenicola]MBL7259238.1 serine protease [Actinoplanes lichenicola]